MHPRTCFLFLSICLFSTVHAAHVNSKNLREIFIRSFDSPSRKPEIDLTCFTCQKSSTNEICNLNAIDESCSQTNNKASPQIRSVFRQEPENFAGCMTIHRFNVVTQETIYIEKKCVKECSSSMVGCQALVTDNDIQTCSYCCSQNYCNLKTVIDTEGAFNLTAGALLNTGSRRSESSIISALLIFVFVLVIL